MKPLYSSHTAEVERRKKGAMKAFVSVAERLHSTSWFFVVGARATHKYMQKVHFFFHFSMSNAKILQNSEPNANTTTVIVCTTLFSSLAHCRHKEKQQILQVSLCRTSI